MPWLKYLTQTARPTSMDPSVLWVCLLICSCPAAGDGLNVVFGAVWRGTGRQWWGAALNLAGWWGVGVPLAVLLSQHMGLNVHGLWGAFAFASALQAAVQWNVLRRLDWNVEVRSKGACGEESTEGASRCRKDLSRVIVWLLDQSVHRMDGSGMCVDRARSSPLMGCTSGCPTGIWVQARASS